MEIRLLSREDLRKIYDGYMVEDFPADELKPWSAIEAMYDRDIYQSYGLYDGQNLLAYACFTGQTKERWLLLDYYAVCAPYRSHGYGSQFLTGLWQTLRNVQGIFVEIEWVDAASNEDERQTRSRRKNFYLRNGLKTTTIRSKLFGVDYEILLMPGIASDLTDAELLEELAKVYQAMFPGRAMDTFVQLTLA